MNPARVIFPALRCDQDDGDAIWPRMREALDMGVGGFIVFESDLARLRDLVDRAHQVAGRPLLFASDLERGAGQQIAGATALPPPAALASLGSEAVAEAARITARQAVAAGVAWIFAPVADLDVEPANPIVGTRSFGSDPETVAELVAVWVAAAQDEGVIACAKHYPGHGRTVADSHTELPVVEVAGADLEADRLPFRAAVKAGVGSVMVAHVAYPSLDPRGTPASLSEPIVSTLRDDLGFQGLVVTDALVMDAVDSADGAERSAPVHALQAGCDVLLYPRDVGAAIEAIDSALAYDVLGESRVAEAVARVDEAIRRTHGMRPPAGDWPAMEESDDARALSLAARSILELRGRLPEPGSTGATRLWVVDDDEEDAADAAAAPVQRGPRSDRLRAGLEAVGVSVLSGDGSGDAIDLIAVFSDVRAWKGRAGLSEPARRRLARIEAEVSRPVLLLFGHPRIAAELPDFPVVLCGWCGDPLMQQAMALRLARRETD